jgi:23S rRNA pseudouridine1911/1915/1917 synthase
VSGSEPITVLLEDNHLIVINKIASQIVQGDKTGDVPLSEHIKNYLKVKYNKPGKVFLGVVHRLDRPVSGAVVFARTDKALSRMNEIFRSRDVQKVYWAIVERRPAREEGKLINWLNKNEKQNKSYVVKDGTAGALRAELDYKLLASSDKYHLLEVQLHTGRHHQIRCQLANMGCIIKGDLKYGAKRSNPDASISLHARSISFTHPVKGERVEIVAPVPDDKLWQYFQQAAATNPE